MKKLASLGLCVLSLCAHAEQHLYFNGFTFGAALGVTSAQLNLKQDLNVTVPALFDMTRADNINLYGNSLAGFLSVGYTYQTKNNFVIAGAFTAGYTDAKDSDSSQYGISQPTGPVTLQDKIDTRLTNDFALVLKPGYVWKETTLFYGLIGPRWGHFKTSLDTDFLYTSAPNNLTVNTSSSVSGYQAGITLGLGIQQLLTTRYSWALEYAYTSYGEIHTPKQSGEVISNGSAVAGSSYYNRPKIDASTNSLVFMLSYMY